MRLLLKILLWLFVGMTVLITVLVALLFFIDVNDYRDRIEQHISATLGRDIVLQGPLRLEPSLFPRIVVNGLKITNPDWVSRPYLATVKKFDIRVGLLPLLRGELNILSLELRVVDLQLEKTSNGINNFTFDKPSEPATTAAIRHLSLYDATVAYVAPGKPVRQLHALHLSWNGPHYTNAALPSPIQPCLTETARS